MSSSAISRSCMRKTAAEKPLFLIFFVPSRVVTLISLPVAQLSAPLQPPEIIIRLDGQTASFKSGAWEILCADIAIFDTRFVHDNVFTVDCMTPHLTHIGVPRPRLQQPLHLRQPSPPDARRPHQAKRLGARLLPSWPSSLAAPCRRPAGRMRPPCPIARIRWAMSTRSTARIRSSSIPCGPSASWASPTSSATCSWARTTARSPLLQRLITHGLTTKRFIVWDGSGRDAYDVRGRTAHEGIFNRNDGRFRCPPTRSRAIRHSPPGPAAWPGPCSAMPRNSSCSPPFDEKQFSAAGFKKSAVMGEFLAAAKDTCDFYIDHGTASDGIPYWDTGAPDLHRLGDWQSRPRSPNNDFEPVDSSAAAIAAQGLLRLGHYLGSKGLRYTQAGLTVAQTLFSPNRTSPPIPGTRACCCTRSTTAPTAGTTSLQAPKSPAANPASGATTTPQN